MNLDELKRTLQEITEAKKKIEATYYQLEGQENLLRMMIAKLESEVVKEIEPKKEE